MAQKFFLAASALIASAVAQQKGPYTPEVHPVLPSWKCTTAGGCVAVNSSVVLDSQYRYTHAVTGSNNCYSNGFNKTLCPDAATCGKNCALEGADYASYGIATTADALTLNLYVKKNGVLSLSSPRVYLLADGDVYNMFSLLNQEISFDVDVSKVPCGVNGALYLSEMEAKGGANANNPAGAAYGTGYCDAQCPVNNFINGQANLAAQGACCNEMDLWEANNAATAFTPHSCNETGVYACSGTTCGGGTNKYKGVCDADGCDYNAYRMGATDFYGPGLTVDTTKPFTVVTQFLTHDNTSTGTLSEIRRIYVQGGKVIQNAVLKTQGIDKTNAISEAFCAAQKSVFGGENAFAEKGGMAGMGGALGRGMVLAFSIWDDAGSNMLWLDGTFPTTATSSTPGAARGPCSSTSGKPADNMKNYPDAAVVFSKIKSGDLGSTFKAVGSMPM